VAYNRRINLSKFLVTGGAGFIGSHLVDALVAGGHTVIVLDDLSTGRHDNLRQHAGSTSVEFVLGSILNEALVDDVVRRVDVVLHFAAAVGVNLIVERPLESLATNIRGSEIVLEKCHKYGRKVLVASTSEIYGKNTSDALNEEDDRILGSPLKTRWSYSEAKAIEEVLAYAYYREKGLPTVIVRLFNTVGPRQVGNYGMVLPRLVDQALRNAPLTVYGTGQQTRCFCHVSDIVVAILGLVNASESEGKVFNVGSRSEISIQGLAEKIREITGSKSKIAYVPYDEAYEAGFEDMQRRRPDTGRIQALLGWQPQRGLDDIIGDVASDIASRLNT
jgi:UDP-glucose 4-epimerase